MESDKSGHSLDADLRGNLVLRVNVNLVKVDFLPGGRVGDLLEDWSDDLARSTPCGPEVDDNRLVAVDLSFAIQSGQHLCQHITRDGATYQILKFVKGFDSLDNHACESICDVFDRERCCRMRCLYTWLQEAKRR